MPSQRSLRFLSSRELLGVKFGLGNIKVLARRLHHPERAYPIVLVAGTNGKGSTVALLESILRAAGARTGRFTSPHLVSVTERIMVDGEQVVLDDLLEVVDHIAEVSEQAIAAGELDAEPTFFETLTACAWRVFEMAAVDVAIFEVGLGGRLDATSIAPAIASVVTPIGIDHQRILGQSIGEIAAEKAAIIKPLRPVVIAPQSKDALEILRTTAVERESPLHQVTREVSVRYQALPGVTRVVVETPEATYDDLELPLLGVHQVDNLATALRAAEVVVHELENTSRDACGLTVAAVRRGVRSVEWPGRLERLEPPAGGLPTFLLDAAHNAMAVDSLVRFLARNPGPRRVVIFGVMADKRFGEMIPPLAEHADHWILTRPPSRRALDPESLYETMRELLPASAVEGRIEIESDPARALERALEPALDAAEVVVCGSIYLLGALRPLIVERLPVYSAD